jgi:hypothetical protein
MDRICSVEWLDSNALGMFRLDMEERFDHFKDNTQPTAIRAPQRRATLLAGFPVVIHFN